VDDWAAGWGTDCQLKGVNLINLINPINYDPCKARVVDTVDRVESRSLVRFQTAPSRRTDTDIPLITVQATHSQTLLEKKSTVLVWRLAFCILQQSKLYKA